MKVVIVSGIYPPDLGGPATHSAELAKDLRARGHQATVLTLWDGDRIRESGGVIRYPRRWPWWLRHVAVVATLVRKRGDYEVIYATGMHEAAVAGGLLARRPVASKVVGNPAWERSRRLGLTSSEFEGFQNEAEHGRRMHWMQWLFVWALRNSTIVTAPSHYLVSQTKEWAGASLPVKMIPNGVRMGPTLGTREALGRNAEQGPLKAIFVGRLVSHKQLPIVFRAVALSKALLTLVGDGPERQSLEQLASEMGIEGRVQFAGAIAHSDTMALLTQADVLVLASSYEGLPHVAIEALACGCPIVTSGAGGTKEVVEHGVTGLIATPTTPENLAAAFDQLARDRALLQALSRNAVQRAGQWSFERSVNLIEELLNDLTPTRKPTVVFFGKGGLQAPSDSAISAKFGTLCNHVKPVLVAAKGRSVGDSRGGRVITFPNLFPPVGNVLFYAMGSVISVAIACGRGKKGVVCQSPYEAVGVCSLAKLLPKRFRPRILVEVHGDWDTAATLYGKSGRRIMRGTVSRVARWGVNHADRVRAVSGYTESLARQAGYEGDFENFPAYLDLSEFLESPPAPLEPEPVVAFLGAMEPAKGPDLLLDAWAGVVERVPSAKLIMVGKGSLLAGLKKRSTRGEFSKSVQFLGEVSRPEVVQLLDKSTVVAVPSRSEGYGRVVLEAYARGRPVVASRVGGLTELVLDGQTGAFVSPENQAELSSALVSVLTDRNRLTDMSLNARTFADGTDPAKEFEQGVARIAGWVLGETQKGSTGQSKAARARKGQPGSRLLVFNLATDADDPILGFTTGWLNALAKQFDHIDVLTMRTGRLDVSLNVNVHSVGKERGYGELRRAANFYRLLSGLLRTNHYEACFAHMMPLFVALGGPLLRANRIPVALWYVHNKAPLTLRAAKTMVETIFTAGEATFPLKSPKVKVVGHGIDTDFFCPSLEARVSGRSFSILVAGRIAPVKRLEVLIESAGHLLREHHWDEMRIRLVGPVAPWDQEYLRTLIRRAKQLGVAHLIKAVGPATSTELLNEYRSADVLVSLTSAGSMDKVVLEALSCAIPVVTSNPEFRKIVDDQLGLTLADDNAQSLVRALLAVRETAPSVREKMGARARDMVMRAHGLERLADLLKYEFTRADIAKAEHLPVR